MKNEVRVTIERVLLNGYIMLAGLLGIMYVVASCGMIGVLAFIAVPMVIALFGETKENNEEMYEEFYYYLEEVCE